MLRSRSALLLMAFCAGFGTSSDRADLLPPTMRRKMCEMAPSLRMCRYQTPILARDPEDFSQFALCQRRPYMPLCRVKLLSRTTEQLDNPENSIVLEVPVKRGGFLPAAQVYSKPPSTLREIERSLETEKQTDEKSMEETESAETAEQSDSEVDVEVGQPFQMSANIFSL